MNDAEIAALLERTSRTFALAIPILEPPSALAREVGLAYLLFRVADTLEDAPRWGRDARSEALGGFVGWLDGEGPFPRGETPPTDHAGCLELLARADALLGAIRATEGGAAIVHHARRTAIGMNAFVARQDAAGGLALRDIADLQRYCYAVAGIVGELLTDLFARDAKVAAARAALDADAATFGEGLQLVNILKDAASDAGEGRAYLPAGIARREVFALARADLACAERYVQTLANAGAPPSVVAFCDLPRRLATATLAALERGEPKISRATVLELYASATRAAAPPR